MVASLIDRGSGSMIYPGDQARVVTPNDATDLPAVTRGIYVGVGGNVAMVLADDSTAVTFSGLAAGMVHPLMVKRVLATGTTATGIVAIY